MPKHRIAAILAGASLLAAAAVAPSQAQTDVDVTLSEAAGSRTLYVENMVGESLTSLDFGAARSLPFRVRVVDSDFDRQSFSVTATMTNMYLDNGALDYTTAIDSADVSLGSQAQPLNVFGVTATVQPLVDTVTTITDLLLCADLGLTILGGVQCEIELSNLVGNLQTVEVPVDLSQLTKLPIIPQANDTGPFTNAEYGAGVGTGDPSPSVDPATSLGVLAGGLGPTSALSEIEAMLATTPLATLVPEETVVSALVAAYPLLGELSTADIDALLTQTVGSVVPLTLTEIVAQTGTYMSLPTLNVNVPAGTTPGDYRGTLVVTALQ